MQVSARGVARLGGQLKGLKRRYPGGIDFLALLSVQRVGSSTSNFAKAAECQNLLCVVSRAPFRSCSLVLAAVCCWLGVIYNEKRANDPVEIEQKHFRF